MLAQPSKKVLEILVVFALHRCNAFIVKKMIRLHTSSKIQLLQQWYEPSVNKKLKMSIFRYSNISMPFNN